MTESTILSTSRPAVAAADWTRHCHACGCAAPAFYHAWHCHARSPQSEWCRHQPPFVLSPQPSMRRREQLVDVAWMPTPQCSVHAARGTSGSPRRASRNTSDIIGKVGKVDARVGYARITAVHRRDPLIRRRGDDRRPPTLEPPRRAPSGGAPRSACLFVRSPTPLGAKNHGCSEKPLGPSALALTPHLSHSASTDILHRQRRTLTG